MSEIKRRDREGRRNVMLELTDADRVRCDCGHIMFWHRGREGDCSICMERGGRCLTP